MSGRTTPSNDAPQSSPNGPRHGRLPWSPGLRRRRNRLNRGGVPRELERAATLTEYVLFISLFILVGVGAVTQLDRGARTYFENSSDYIGKPRNHDMNAAPSTTTGGGGGWYPPEETTIPTLPPPTTVAPTTAAPTTAAPTTAAPTTTKATTTTVAPTTTKATTTTTVPPGGWRGQVQMWFGSPKQGQWNGGKSHFEASVWSTGNVPVNGVKITVNLYRANNTLVASYSCTTPAAPAEARCSGPEVSVQYGWYWKVDNVAAPTWDGQKHTTPAWR